MQNKNQYTDIIWCPLIDAVLIISWQMYCSFFSRKANMHGSLSDQVSYGNYLDSFLFL